MPTAVSSTARQENSAASKAGDRRATRLSPIIASIDRTSLTGRSGSSERTTRRSVPANDAGATLVRMTT